MVRATRHRSWRYWLYPAYWHYRLRHAGRTVGSAHAQGPYYGAIPNRGAGIGHQITCWAAGCHYAQVYGLQYAYAPFGDARWDQLLGYGQGETTVEQLRQQGYKVRRLPLTTDDNSAETAMNRRIIDSYGDAKVVFLAELDQFYTDLPQLQQLMQQKFYAAPSRQQMKLCYDPACYNIAIHVRRGDIMADPQHENLRIRYLSNDYFRRVLDQVLDRIRPGRPIHVWFFSQGKPADYPEFSHVQNLHWCMDMDPYLSFVHMVYADLIVTSKSSFSYKPALLSRGIKVCPRLFWHPYPTGADWVLVENDGSFKPEELEKLKIEH